MLYSIHDGKELLEILIFTVLFYLSFKAHKTFIPKGYFVLNEVVYFFDMKRFWTASNVRLAFIGAIILFGYYEFKITSHTVYYTALLLVGIIQILPVIQRYKLYKFWRGALRFELLFINLFYIAILLLMGFACLEFIVPPLAGEKGYFDTTYPSINFMIGVAIYLIPIFIQFQVIRKSDYFNLARIDFVHTDTAVRLRNLNVLQNDRFGTAWNYKKLINDMSDKNNIDSEILMTILLIEEFNRGSICHQLQEKFLVSLFPGIVLKKDMSLGLGQIKLSTASRLLDVSKGEALPLLMNPIKNIEICARYLALLLKQYNEFIDQYNKALDVNSAMNPISKKDKSVLSLGGYIIQYDFDEFDYIAKNYLGTINYKQYEGLLYAAIIRNRVKYRRFNDMIRAKPQNMR